MSNSANQKMFISSTYENKMQQTKTARTQRQESQSMKPNTVQRKWVIGSSHYGENINYQRDYQFFSMDDVPKVKKESHDTMCEFVDPDLLGLKKMNWNGSSKIPKYPHLEETFERKLMKIKIGLLDHPIPRYKPNTIYTGTETREDYTGWNVSTAQSLLERKKMLEEDTQKAMEMTAKKKNIVTNYITPLQYTTGFNDKLRETKKEEEMLRASIRDKYKYENPTSSHQRVDGAVYRLTYEHKVKHAKPQSEIEAANLTFQPDLSATLKRPNQFNMHTRTFQVVKSIQQSGEGPTLTYNPVIEKTTENYLISTKKNKTIDDTWYISPEEEARIERYQKANREKIKHEDIPSGTLD